MPPNLPAPSADAWQAAIAQLSAKPRAWRPREIPAERPKEPQLRSPESIAVWRVLCEATEPMQKGAILDAAGLVMRARTNGPRNAGRVSLRNLVDGGWVALKGGLYRKP